MLGACVFPKFMSKFDEFIFQARVLIRSQLKCPLVSCDGSHKISTITVNRSKMEVCIR